MAPKCSSRTSSQLLSVSTTFRGRGMELPARSRSEVNINTACWLRSDGIWDLMGSAWDGATELLGWTKRPTKQLVFQAYPKTRTSLDSKGLRRYRSTYVSLPYAPHDWAGRPPSSMSWPGQWVKWWYRGSQSHGRYLKLWNSRKKTSISVDTLLYVAVILKFGCFHPAHTLTIPDMSQSPRTFGKTSTSRVSCGHPPIWATWVSIMFPKTPKGHCGRATQ